MDIISKTDKEMIIESRSSKKRYTINYRGCSCEGYKYRWDCKHIRDPRVAAWFLVAKRKSRIIPHGEGHILWKNLLSLLLGDKKDKYIERMTAVGELRRREATISCIDIVVTLKRKDARERIKHLMQEFGMELTKEDDYSLSFVSSKGVGVFMFISDRTHHEMDVLFRTGPESFISKLKRTATRKGMTLSRKGLYTGNTILADEEDKIIHLILGEYILPEGRKDN